MGFGYFHFQWKELVEKRRFGGRNFSKSRKLGTVETVKENSFYRLNHKRHFKWQSINNALSSI